MRGKMRAPYYLCRPDARHHADRRDWYADHPPSVYVREDDLLTQFTNSSQNTSSAPLASN
jgi:hypothetical protein